MELGVGHSGICASDGGGLWLSVAPLGAISATHVRWAGGYLTLPLFTALVAPLLTLLFNKVA